MNNRNIKNFLARIGLRANDGPLQLEALFNAVNTGDQKTVAQLITKKVPVNKKNEYGCTPLEAALQLGHTHIVDQLIKAKVPLDLKENNALIQAAYYGHTSLVSYLISKKASINRPDKKGCTALMAAAFKGHENIIRLLMKEKCDLNLRDIENKTALHIAIYNGHTNIAVQLITAKADLNVQNNQGNTALSYAATLGNEKIVKQLLEEKCNINTFTQYEYTPLLEAVYRGRFNSVSLLLEAKADIGIKNYFNETAFDIAIKKGRSDIFHLLINTKKIEPSLLNALFFFAASHRRATILLRLLEEKPSVDLDHMNLENKTALMLMSSSNDSDITEPLKAIEKLIHAKASLNIQNKEGNTALHLATNDKIAYALIQAKASIEVKNKKGQTPLITATRSKHPSVITKLIEEKAFLNAQDNDGNTACIWAAYKGYHSLLAILLDAQADMELTNKHKNTALEEAIRKESYQTMRCLLERGAILKDPNRIVTYNNRNRTLFSWACEQKDNETAALLIKKGVKISTSFLKTLYLGSLPPSFTLLFLNHEIVIEHFNILHFLIGSNQSDPNVIDILYLLSQEKNKDQYSYYKEAKTHYEKLTTLEQLIDRNHQNKKNAQQAIDKAIQMPAVLLNIITDYYYQPLSVCGFFKANQIDTFIEENNLLYNHIAAALA